jgi:hypothetical protein
MFLTLSLLAEEEETDELRLERLLLFCTFGFKFEPVPDPCRLLY